ncbi:hypothetical protein RG963_06775 [Methanosarcina sp. Z-7115]|uniref:Uncharacterized protein n=1 Tax=Methanosarcina baikalica TaxID=3073890 RepID=A0ABU2D0L2_9EURY|nr:hypothetical protein [Methanosarcina sp. Z-7115]MDR7665486.1 hypothetical protein [Methanosarcina sp. Z-7115]
MVEMGNESLFEGVVFVVIVAAICAAQGVRTCIGRAGHSVSVKVLGA